MWYYIGKRRGIAEGWNERHFEQIEREKKRRDANGRFKVRRRESLMAKIIP
jgi:hypothetical protein